MDPALAAFTLYSDTIARTHELIRLDEALFDQIPDENLEDLFDNWKTRLIAKYLAKSVAENDLIYENLEENEGYAYRQRVFESAQMETKKIQRSITGDIVSQNPTNSENSTTWLDSTLQSQRSFINSLNPLFISPSVPPDQLSGLNVNQKRQLIPNKNAIVQNNTQNTQNDSIKNDTLVLKDEDTQTEPSEHLLDVPITTNSNIFDKLRRRIRDKANKQHLLKLSHASQTIDPHSTNSSAHSTSPNNIKNNVSVLPPSMSDGWNDQITSSDHNDKGNEYDQDDFSSAPRAHILRQNAFMPYLSMLYSDDSQSSHPSTHNTPNHPSMTTISSSPVIHEESEENNENCDGNSEKRQKMQQSDQYILNNQNIPYVGDNHSSHASSQIDPNQFVSLTASNIGSTNGFGPTIKNQSNPQLPIKQEAKVKEETDHPSQIFKTLQQLKMEQLADDKAQAELAMRTKLQARHVELFGWLNDRINVYKQYSSSSLNVAGIGDIDVGDQPLATDFAIPIHIQTAVQLGIFSHSLQNRLMVKRWNDIEITEQDKFVGADLSHFADEMRGYEFHITTGTCNLDSLSHRLIPDPKVTAQLQAREIEKKRQELEKKKLPNDKGQNANFNDSQLNDQLGVDAFLDMGMFWDNEDGDDDDFDDFDDDLNEAASKKKRGKKKGKKTAFQWNLQLHNCILRIGFEELFFHTLNITLTKKERGL